MVFQLQSRVYPRLEVLRNGNADIGVLIVTACEWGGVKIYDVVILKRNLALVCVTGYGDEWLCFEVCPGADCWLAIVMVKRYLFRWNWKLIAYIRVSADERKPYTGKALDDSKEFFGGKNGHCSSSCVSNHVFSPFCKYTFKIRQS